MLFGGQTSVCVWRADNSHCSDVLLSAFAGRLQLWTAGQSKIEAIVEEDFSFFRQPDVMCHWAEGKHKEQSGSTDWTDSAQDLQNRRSGISVMAVCQLGASLWHVSLRSCDEMKNIRPGRTKFKADSSAQSVIAAERVRASNDPRPLAACWFLPQTAQGSANQQRRWGRVTALV